MTQAVSAGIAALQATMTGPVIIPGDSDYDTPVPSGMVTSTGTPPSWPAASPRPTLRPPWLRLGTGPGDQCARRRPRVQRQRRL
jgi:hypothetical protein